MEPVQPNASVAATGFGIRYVGDYCYAYSGGYATTTSAQTVLEATTGSGIIVGTFQFNGAVKLSAPGEGQISSCTIKLNGEVVSVLKADTEDSYNGLTTVTQEIILAPFTIMECSVISSGADADRLNTVTLTGRVYGAEE